MKVKFGVFADLHIDIMHDGEARLEQLLSVCREENVDFVIQLGDFIYPNEDRKCICKPENIPPNVQSALAGIAPVDKDRMLKMYAQFEKPTYHVIGNHECDVCSKRQILEYWGERDAYYSFDAGGVHFVVLDPNYGKVDGEYISYENGNYFDWPKCIPYLPDEQISWLEEDLKKTEYPTVLFSHQRLMEGYASIKNAEKLRKVLTGAPSGVILSVNGHEHRDMLEEKDGIYFLNHNSASAMWVGTKYVCMNRYGEEIDRLFPDIRHMLPYSKPLFSIITIDENGIEVKGTRAEFVGPSPEEMGMYDEDIKFVEHGIKITAEIENRFLPLHK